MEADSEHKNSIASFLTDESKFHRNIEWVLTIMSIFSIKLFAIIVSYLVCRSKYRCLFLFKTCLITMVSFLVLAQVVYSIVSGVTFAKIDTNYPSTEKAYAFINIFSVFIATFALYSFAFSIILALVMFKNAQELETANAAERLEAEVAQINHLIRSREQYE